MTTTVLPLLSSGGYQKKLSASESNQSQSASPLIRHLRRRCQCLTTSYAGGRRLMVSPSVRPAICMTLMSMCMLNAKKIDPRYAEMLILGTALAGRNSSLRALTSRRKPSESYTLLQNGWAWCTAAHTKLVRALEVVRAVHSPSGPPKMGALVL